MKNSILRFIRKVLGISNVEDLIFKTHQTQMYTMGKLLEHKILEKEKVKDFSEVEFKIFSQWGDDGIIQWLINKIKIENDFFIEFGVQDYSESNTRFLLGNNNWEGLVIDGNNEFIDFIKNDNLSWKHSITALNRFITKDNINSIIGDNCPFEDIGILSVDIDGNDYWTWEAIDVVKPRIVISEYNSLWGNELSLSTPYADNFVRSNSHYSNLYFGASIHALINLGKKKGYTFVGTNTNGNNAYFVKDDLAESVLNSLDEVKIHTARFRESRDQNGKLTLLNQEQGRKLIGDLLLTDTKTLTTKKISEIFN